MFDSNVGKKILQNETSCCHYRWGLCSLSQTTQQPVPNNIPLSRQSSWLEMAVTAKMINLWMPLILDSPLSLLILSSSFFHTTCLPVTGIICEAIMIFILWGQAGSVSYIWMYLENEEFLLWVLQEEIFHLDNLTSACFCFLKSHTVVYQQENISCDLIKMEVFLEGRPMRPGSSPKSQSKQCSVKTATKICFIPHALMTFTQSHGFPPWCCLLIPSLYFPSLTSLGACWYTHSFIQYIFTEHRWC